MLTIICAQCGEDMSEATRYHEPGVNFYECDNCGDTVIVLDAPRDEVAEAADYHFERAGDR